METNWRLIHLLYRHFLASQGMATLTLAERKLHEICAIHQSSSPGAILPFVKQEKIDSLRFNASGTTHRCMCTQECRHKQSEHFILFKCISSIPFWLNAIQDQTVQFIYKITLLSIAYILPWYWPKKASSYATLVRIAWRICTFTVVHGVVLLILAAFMSKCLNFINLSNWYRVFETLNKVFQHYPYQ